ncbi:MAG: MarR family winged helix-turn-helix transcriptional regulator [Tranquillimonas sp.]|jgi:DNA-binding MarR family transcriptional regulator
MSEPYRLHHSLGYRLSLTARLQEKRLDEGLKTLGLSRTTWCVLLAVGNEGLTQPSDIAAFVGIDRTATSRALRQMERDALVDRSVGLADRRTTRVALTPRGREVLAAGTPMAERNNAWMDAKLSQTERLELRRLLAKLSAGEDAELHQI